MGIEILGSRVLAPVYGYSIYVWGALLGTVMIALSLGYMIGGRIADKKNDIGFLLKMIIVASALTFIIPYIAMPVMKYIVNYGVIFGTIVSAFIIISPPVFLLAFVSPYIIKLLAKKDKIGHIAGNIYGISTIGSIFGTFITSFILISAIGTKLSLFGFSFILLFISILGYIINKNLFKKKVVSVLFVCFFFCVLVSNITYVDPDKDNIVYEIETIYNTLMIYEDNNILGLKMNTLDNFQSFIRKDTIATFQYWDYLNIAPIINEAKNALYIGVGGGTGIVQFEYYFNMNEIVGVEIDKEVIKLSLDYFGVNKSGIVDLVAQDGRAYFRNNPNKKFDVIIVDAYSGGTSIPHYMVTQEFFAELNDHLSDNGVVVANVVSNNQKRDLVKPFIKTIDSVYENVYFLQLRSNTLIYSLKNDIGLDEIQNRVKDYYLLNKDIEIKRALEDVFQYLSVYNKNYDDVSIYTDDKNDVEKTIFKVWHDL
jgi:spermidine synthase